MVRECAIDALSDNLQFHEIDYIENIIRNASNISLSDIFKATCEEDFANLNRHRESLEDKELIDAFGSLCKEYSHFTTSHSISVSEFETVARNNGIYICYAIPLIQKMSNRAGYEIGQKLNDNMVVIVLNNIHKAFNSLSDKRHYINISMKSMAIGMYAILKQLNFLCNMVNQWELILSSEISEALFSNQNQLAEIIRTKSTELRYALNDFSIFDQQSTLNFEWDFKSDDYLPIYRNKIEQEKKRKAKQEEERKLKEEEERKRKEQKNQNQPNLVSSSSSSSVQQKSSNGGCYIATLVYGDYDHPKVKVLRHFRDNILLKTIFGKKFVNFYYKYSPGWVQYLKNKKRTNRFIRSILDCFVYIYRKIKNV
jgi:hypothetical protein